MIGTRDRHLRSLSQSIETLPDDGPMITGVPACQWRSRGHTRSVAIAACSGSARSLQISPTGPGKQFKPSVYPPSCRLAIRGRQALTSLGVRFVDGMRASVTPWLNEDIPVSASDRARRRAEEARLAWLDRVTRDRH